MRLGSLDERVRILDELARSHDFFLEGGHIASGLLLQDVCPKRLGALLHRLECIDCGGRQLCPLHLFYMFIWFC